MQLSKYPFEHDITNLVPLTGLSARISVVGNFNHHLVKPEPASIFIPTSNNGAGEDPI